nr:hypothetical protein [uncultured Campylobacter sp.]
MHFTHILFSIVFAVAYCVVAEKFLKSRFGKALRSVF